jgi:hypothetical protein
LPSPLSWAFTPGPLTLDPLVSEPQLEPSLFRPRPAWHSHPTVPCASSKSECRDTGSASGTPTTSQGFPFPFPGIRTAHEAEAAPVTRAPTSQFASAYPITHLIDSVLASHHLIPPPYLASLRPPRIEPSTANDQHRTRRVSRKMIVYKCVRMGRYVCGLAATGKTENGERVGGRESSASTGKHRVSLPLAALGIRRCARPVDVSVDMLLFSIPPG